MNKTKVLLCILALSLFIQLSYSKDFEKIDPRLLTLNSHTADVMIHAKDNTILEELNAEAFEMGNFYSAKIAIQELDKLENSDSILLVAPEKQYDLLLDVSALGIDAPQSWNLGYNGSGIKVCVLDTGINRSHPALASRIIDEQDFVTTDNDGNSTMDFSGHGTHVAGIVASQDPTYHGIAPGAQILNAKIFNSNTVTAPESAIMRGIDWCIEKGADILTLSLGGLDQQNYGTDILSQYVDLAVDKGKIVTVAAGNSGPGTNKECRTSRDSTGSSYSICSPGIAHKVITVGSTQTGKLNTIKDAVSGFSSRGPTGDGRIKPDVSAPGEWITSTGRDGRTNTLRGTSMSTPHIAGIAAIALQARKITPEEFKALIMNSADDFGYPGKDNNYGAGRANVTSLLAMLNNTIRDSINSSYKSYNIFVPTGSKEIRATLYWPEDYTTDNNLDLYLLDPSGNIIAYSASTSSTDELIRLADPHVGGNWKLLVASANSKLQTYALSSNFAPIHSKYFVTGNITNTVAYHKIYVGNATNLTINLDWNNINTNFSLKLFSPLGSIANYTQSHNDNNIEAITSGVQSGIWLARITSDDAYQYSLTSNQEISAQIIDTTAPTIQVLSPMSRTYSQVNTLKLKVDDNTNAPIECTTLLDNDVVFSRHFVNNSTVSAAISVSQGVHLIDTTCTDDAGNTKNISVSFTVDTAPPLLALTSPKNTTYNSNSVLLNFTLSESDIDKIWYRIDNKAEIQVQNATLISVQDGFHTAYLFVNDTSGNLNMETISFSVDTKPIGISFIDPTPNSSSIVTGTVIINATTSETPSSIQLEWDNRNESMLGRNRNWFKQKDNLTPGNYSFKIYINDTIGNINVSQVRTISVSIPLPANGSSNQSANNTGKNISDIISDKNISVVMFDSNGNIINTTMIVSSDVYSIRFNSSGTILEVSGFLGGNINLSARVNITRKLVLEKNISSIFNQSGGVLEDYVWMDLSNLIDGPFGAKVTFSKKHVIFFYLSGSKDNLILSQIKNMCNPDLSNLPCYNNSSVHLSSFSGVAAGSDYQNPSISITSPSATTYSSATVQLTYDAQDNAQIDRCWYALNSAINTTLENCASATITAASGTNALTVYANDTSSRIANSSVIFTYTPSNPPSNSGGSSGGGGGGGGGGYSPPPIQKKNQTNSTPTLNKSIITLSNATINSTNLTTTSSAVLIIDQNTTLEEIPEALNTTQQIPSTGFAIGSNNLAAGGIGVAIIGGGLITWKSGILAKRKPKKTKRPAKKKVVKVKVSKKKFKYKYKKKGR